MKHGHFETKNHIHGHFRKLCADVPSLQNIDSNMSIYAAIKNQTDLAIWWSSWILMARCASAPCVPRYSSCIGFIGLFHSNTCRLLVTQEWQFRSSSRTPWGQNMLTFQNVGVFIEGNYKTCWLFSVACSFVGSAVRVTLVCVQVQCTIGSSWKEICIRQECRGVLHKLSNVFTNPNLIGDPRMHQCLITCQLPNNLCSTWHLWSELWVLGRRDRTFVTTVKAEHVLLPGARWESMQWECLKS